MIAERSKDSPKVISCPPLVFLAAFAIGWLLDWVFPVLRLPSPVPVVGGILIVAGIALGMWGVRTMHRAGTAVRPRRPVTALVTDGPFRYTRNPLYIALVTIYVGIILASGALWPLATLIPALWALRWKIVKGEEQFLEMKFGAAYRAYKARVRRWV
ncbi:MAG: methyltransferase family protein [Limisphaerales bacterium]